MLQAASIRPEIVSRVGMTFSSVDHAYHFYSKYVEEAGFGIKRYREKTYVKWLNCTREGASASSNSPVPKERNRGTKRGGCKAGMKLRKHLNSNKEVTSVAIEVFEASHNHPMLTKQAAIHYYSAKKRDPTYKEFINQLNDACIHKLDGKYTWKARKHAFDQPRHAKYVSVVLVYMIVGTALCF